MTSMCNPFRKVGTSVVRHVEMTRTFSPPLPVLVVKVAIIFALFCVLQTTGLSNSSPKPTPQNFHHFYRSHHHNNVTQYPHSNSRPHPDLLLAPSSSYSSTHSSHTSDDHNPLMQQDQPFRLDDVDDTYDPVEAYHQLRRQYLTSTSRVDRAYHGISSSSGTRGWDSSSSSSSYSSSGRTRHHSHIQSNYHHPQQNQNGGGSSGSSDRDNNRNDNGQRSYGGGQIKAGGESAHNHQSYNYLPHPNPQQNFILNQQRCYVCLPPNKSSREAKDILAMFGKEDPKDIADCAEFTQANARGYAFNCPPGFGGCILRIHGLNVSRACSKYRLNDCKKANSVEFCYCTEPLCNDVKPPPIPLYTSGEEDDDEDNLGGGSGDRSRSTKEEETPSDSELLHTPTSSSSDSHKNKNNKDSVALANFNDNENHDQGGDDVRGLTDGDLKLGSSSSGSSSSSKISSVMSASLLLLSLLSSLFCPLLSLFSLFWWMVLRVCETLWWNHVMFITTTRSPLGESTSLVSGGVKSVRAKTTLYFS